MEKSNFEEYRQPWETGPHWELKREFLERYQNDFPEDRLLCLAQAYSNIELMHCSYPDPVMFQIHELSKPLRGNKRFRETSKNIAKNEPELQARPRKRTALDDLKKPFKFIKFFSVGTQSSSATEKLATDDNASEVASELNISPEGSSNVQTTDFPSETLSKNPSTVIESNLKCSPSHDIDIEDCFFSDEYGCRMNNTNFFLSIAQSPNLKLINEMAVALNNIKGNKAHRKKLRPHEDLELAAKNLNVANQVFFNICGKPEQKRCICEFYIGDTLISIGRDTNEKTAKRLAGCSAVEILEKISNLPLKTLKSDIDEEELCFLRKFTEKVTNDTESESSASAKIGNACTALNCSSLVSFFGVRENLRSPLNCRIFICDFVIKNVLIGHGKATSKKSAKEDAAKKGIQLLAKYFNIEYKDVIYKDEYKDMSFKPVTVVHKIQKKSQPQTKDKRDSKKTMESSDSLNVSCLEKEKSPIKTGPFRMNYELLDNSFRHQFAILDNSEIAPLSQKKAQNIINYSMQFCKKSFSYEMPEPNYTEEEGCCYRCDFILEGCCIGSGASTSKAEAKYDASVQAIENLQNQFYTIKIRNETEDGFFIHRNQIINVEVPTNAVSDNNIGCKMLKMMGWTGGGLGTNGIAEPITASEHRFHQGLGFSSGDTDKKKFRQKIDSLLREFSHTETTDDLIFGADFTKDERKEIHKIADRFGLVSSSRGKNENRQLYVRHKLSITEILNQLVRCGGCTSKYELVDRSSHNSY